MKTVLVVEDCRAEQRLIVSLLQHAGLNVVIAETGESALAWLAEHERPNAILLDIVMPGLSGLELCRQLRADPDMGKVPIIFCSAKGKEFDQFWALRQGGNGYIRKPFVPMELIQTVCGYVNENNVVAG